MRMWASSMVRSGPSGRCSIASREVHTRVDCPFASATAGIRLKSPATAKGAEKRRTRMPAAYQKVDCAEMRLRNAWLCLPLLLAPACDAEKPAATPAEKQADDKDEPAKAEVPKAEVPKAAAPKIEKDTPAKQVVAAWGHPDIELAPTEGIACFEYKAGPKKVVCYSLLTESATWPQVFGENYKVSEVRDPTPEDAEGATEIKKPVNPEPDPAEPMH